MSEEPQFRLEKLRAAVERLGVPRWRPMLRYVAGLHERSTHRPRDRFSHGWEEIGPGYCYGPAFGHWDLIHQIRDVVHSEPEHARRQILNNLAFQREDGFLPGTIYVKEDGLSWSEQEGHPPVWPVAVDGWAAAAKSDQLKKDCLPSLRRQIAWFESNRAAEPQGFFYRDVLGEGCESGVDRSVRFEDAPPQPLACVDATSHLYLLYRRAAAWSRSVGEDGEAYEDKAASLGRFLRSELWCDETCFFHDIWAVREPEQRPLALEGIWPVAVGAAAPEQAYLAVYENLLNPNRFFAFHPLTTVGVRDGRFRLRMWRGPAWNSMTWWAARGCARYGLTDAAVRILERALEASADVFERTGTIWEFYHPYAGPQEELERKPDTEFNTPCRDYLGHNPLIAMARLHDACAAGGES